MKNIIIVILIIAIAALFIVPESKIGEYRGLLKTKYFLRDTAKTVWNIIFSFARTGEKPKELDIFEQKALDTAKEGAKDVLKESATEVIEIK